jgi:hypothetical protein
MLKQLVLSVAILIPCSASLMAASGAMTVVIRDAVTGDPIDQSMGSNVNDYDQYSLNLYRVATSHIFNDGAVGSTATGFGYKVTAWASNYYERTKSDIQVSGGSTTVATFYLYRPTLLISFSPGSATEGTSATGTVSLLTQSGGAAKLHNSLTITLTSADPSRASVQASVTIPSMTSSGSFSIGAVDNAIDDGDVSVSIAASVSSWGYSDHNLMIIDND